MAHAESILTSLILVPAISTLGVVLLVELFKKGAR